MNKLEEYIKDIEKNITLQPIKLSAHIRALTSIKFNQSSDLLFTTAKDKTPMVWDANTGQRLGTYVGHKGAVWSCDINNDSTMLITGSSDQFAIIWDIKTGDIIKSIEYEAGVKSVCFGSNNLICVVTDDMCREIPKITISDISSEINIVCEYESPIKINKAIFNKDNTKIYFCCIDGSISILDIETSKIVLTKTIYKKYNCKTIRFENNFNTLITGSDDCTSCLLNPKDLSIIKIYNVNFPINSCLIFKDYVITAGGLDAQSVTTSEGNKFDIKFYSKIFEEFMGSFSNHFGPVNSIDISQDGKLFASAGEDGFCYIYKL